MSKISGWQPFRQCLDHTDPFQDLDDLKSPGSHGDRQGRGTRGLSSDADHHVEWVPESRFDDYHQGYIIEIEIPAVPREHIQIRVCHKTIKLRVTGTLSGSGEISETEHARLERKINLPEDADPKEIIATFPDGSIRLAVGRKASKRTRRINLRFD
jgi:HSP20 family molecular chaperone IbpA